jgi:hypothetical protein
MEAFFITSFHLFLSFPFFSLDYFLFSYKISAIQFTTSTN